MITDVLEALVRYAQKNLEKESKTTDDKTLAISCAGLFKKWERGPFEVGDIRTDGKTPYECQLDHDSRINTDWTIDVRTVWKPYHSRMKEWALPFIHPTCADDIYKAGEYMIYTDGKIYLAKMDTDFSPDEYPKAWEVADD